MYSKNESLQHVGWIERGTVKPNNSPSPWVGQLARLTKPQRGDRCIENRIFTPQSPSGATGMSSIWLFLIGVGDENSTYRLSSNLR